MIAAEAQHHRAKTPAAAFEAAARALIVRTLLLEEAARRGIEPAPELVAPGKRELKDEALIRALMEREIAAPTPGEESCQWFYETEKERFRSPDLYEASHILFLAKSGDVEAREEARAQAQAVADELAAAPERFAAIAAERSACDSRAQGGRLGQIAEGQTVPEFEQALKTLAEGEISPPVMTRFGAHVIRLDARLPGQILPYAYVRDHIASYLAERQWRVDAAAYLGRLIAAAEIEGVTFEQLEKAA
jgi:peptidyl-prolyl cis-trans isomerase C